VDELTPGMRLHLSTVTDVRELDSLRPLELDEAALVGWLHGDGFTGQYDHGHNRSLTLEFMTVNDDEHGYVMEKVDRVFKGIHRHVRSTPSKNPALSIRRIRLYGEVLRKFVEKYGLLQKAEERSIPAAIVQGGKSAQTAYLCSLFQADGTVRLRNRATRTADVELTTTSPKIAKDVQTLLANLGIYSRINSSEDKRPSRREAFQVSIGYAQARTRFRDLIGFVSGEKRSRLDTACSTGFPGKAMPWLREEAILRIEPLGEMPVYDIQTGSGRYLSNNVLVHNCFILSINDDLVNEGGIMDLITREARLFKYGSGTGTNYSKLRASNEPLSGGGVSSGLLSFLKVSDRSASSIKSGGTTRRAARMVTLDADHPDVFKYVDWKVQEERKVAAMVTGSRILRKNTRRLLDACRSGGPNGSAIDPAKNPELARAIRRAFRPPTSSR
jgi:ribonucleoside-diphosphate reductase alpha chain